ncbi:MAG: DUF1810 domain-containing protein [Casimicrobiaceae bacterium]
MAAQDDPYNLARFVAAQAHDYSRALAEIRAGSKRTHWIWHVMPQLRGLGSSRRAMLYGIGSAEEARAYLAHPVLGPRLRECVAALNALATHDPVQVLGATDAVKFRSCLTLFRFADPADTGFSQALVAFFGGVADLKSLAMLNASGLDRSPA